MGGKTRVQGKDRERARRMLADALAVQEAGAFAVVLELMPEQLAAAITERLRIPTIGIGAGARLQRPGPGHHRPARPGLVHPAARPALRGPAPDHPRRRHGLRHGRRRGHLPGRGAELADGRVGAGRTCWARARSTASRRLPGQDPARPGLCSRVDARTVTVLRTRAELRDALVAAPRPIGLVPTMGWLHAGHRSLMQRARAMTPRP